MNEVSVLRLALEKIKRDAGALGDGAPDAGYMAHEMLNIESEAALALAGRQYSEAPAKQKLPEWIRMVNSTRRSVEKYADPTDLGDAQAIELWRELEEYLKTH